MSSFLNIRTTTLAFVGVLASVPFAAAQSICARVRVQISQDAVISRNAFEANLTINNGSPDQPMLNVGVQLEIRDPDGVLANDRFDIRPPTLTGIGDVNGGGMIPPDASASAQWIIVPFDSAAPTEPLVYSFGGSFTYTLPGGTLTIPMTPAFLTVLPNPSLIVKYFLEKVVYSDDPFTLQVEPAIPFTLGLIMSNVGAGAANNIRIMSAQPQVIENERGLLINFQIIGTQVGNEPRTPSLNINLGDIGPGQSAVARWLLTASLQGQFIAYNASFQHVNGLGVPEASLVDSVEIFETVHVVRIETPADDGLPDFLTNEPPDAENLADRVHGSDGQVFPVTSVTEAVIDGPPVPGDFEVVVTAKMPAGFGYLRIDDPGDGRFRLVGVTRQDGGTVRVGDNAWLTARTLHPVGEPARDERFFHLFDFNGTDEYHLHYETRAQTPGAPLLDEPTSSTALLVSLGDVNEGFIEHAVYEQSTGQWVGPTGRLQADPYWQPAEQWQGLRLRALAASSEYRFQSKARSAIDGETALGPVTDVTTTRAGDVNGDNLVDETDVDLVRAALGTQYGDEGYDARADLNGDDLVTFRDLGIVRRNQE